MALRGDTHTNVPYDLVSNQVHPKPIPAYMQACKRHLQKSSETLSDHCAAVTAHFRGWVWNSVPGMPSWCGKSKCKMLHFFCACPPAGVESVAECPCPFMNATGACERMNACPFKHTPEMREGYRARQLLTQLTEITSKPEGITNADFHICAGLISNLCQHIYRIRVKDVVMMHLQDAMELISKIAIIRSANRERVDQDIALLACLVYDLLPLEPEPKEELLNAFVDRAYIGNTACLELKLFAIAVFTELVRGVRLAELTQASFYPCVEHIAVLAVLEQSEVPVTDPQQLQELKQELTLLQLLTTEAMHDWMMNELKVNE